MDDLVQAHYFPLSSQANVYTLTFLHLANGTYKMLVASLRREVYYFEYMENSSGILMPTAKEVSFTYIPSGAEIISMDAFNRNDTKNDFVIGITIIKNSNDLNTLETYLNIYSEWEESSEFNIESISQNRLNTIELKFIPYQLTHTFLINWNEEGLVAKEVVFLLSGSDNQVHIYKENSNHTYKEIESKESFPEFHKPPSIIVWMDILYCNNFEERLTVFGCECGYVRLCKVLTKTNKIFFNFSTRFTNPIANVCLYSSVSKKGPPSFLQDFSKEQSCQTHPVINLIVVNTALPAVFFSDVINYSLKKYATLPRHEMSSILTCTAVCDLDLDGSIEILLGSSSQEVMLHKFNEKTGWRLTQIKKFPAPIMSIKCVDVAGDGVKEVIVLTLKGIHILQLPSILIDKVIEDRINDMTISTIE